MFNDGKKEMQHRMEQQRLREKETIRRINQRTRDEVVNGGEDDNKPFDFSIWGLIGFFIAYLPFVIIAGMSGTFVHDKFLLEPLISVLIALAVGFLTYFSINKIEFYSDTLKIEGNWLYLPIKIFVLLFVSGLPFIVGYSLGASFIGEESPIQKIIVGIIGGSILAVPAYIRVILSNKSGY